MSSSFWNKIISSGTSGDEQYIRDNRKIISTNLAALTIAALTILFIPYFYYLRLANLSILLAIVTLLVSHTIVLNSLRLVIAAKIWLIGLSNFSCYQLAMACGKESGIHYVILPLCALPFLLFDLKNKKEIVILSCIAIALFFVVQYGVFTKSIFHIDKLTLSKIYYPTIIAAFIILLFLMFYLSFENEAAEKSLVKLKESFEKEIDAARKVINQSNYTNSTTIAEVLMSQIKQLQSSKDILNKTHKRLKKTNNDLDNFIYTVSHDLKYPISNIEGLLNALMSHPSFEDEDFKLAVNMISKSVARFKNTIGELTEITKIQTSQDDISEINFEDLLGEVLYSLKDQIKDCGIQFIINYQYTFVYFSRRNLRSILYNLVSNAIKYRSVIRIPIIDISTREISPDFFELSVKDNGLGIHESHRDKIFSMFKRVHDHVEGSGVGLYIVKRIVDNNGGRIELSSELDKGSEFRIILRKASLGQIVE